MRKIIFGLLLALSIHSPALGADVKISQLPLGSAASSNASDSFPYVSVSDNTTKRLRLSDLVNLPSMSSTYLSGTVQISHGGTGQTTSANAINALMPNQSGHSGECITSNGSAISWGDCNAGVVSSVGLSMPNIFTVTNSPVTSTGTLTSTLNAQAANLVFAGGASASATPTFRSLVSDDIPSLSASKITSGQLAVANGGTALASGTSGGLLYFSSGSAIQSSAAYSTNSILVGQGAGAAPSPIPTGTPYQVLRIPSSGGAPGFGSIDLGQTATTTSQLLASRGGTGQDFSGSTGVIKVSGGTFSAGSVALGSQVSGFLPLANGGTGTSAISAAAAFNALAPTTTIGDTIALDSGGNVRIAGNVSTTRKFYSQVGSGAASAIPTWDTVALTDLPVVSVAKGGTGQSSSLTQYGVVYANTTTSMATTGTGAAGEILTSNGSGAAPTFQASAAVGSPSGTIVMYGGSTAPTGWQICDGTAISRSTYANLFTAIGTTYGVGNGSTTFNIPDFRNVFPRGANASTRSIGGITYPAVTRGTTTNDKFQGHNHLRNADSINELTDVYPNSPTSGVNAAYGAGSQTRYYQYTAGPTDDGTNGTPRTGTESAPVNLGVNFIIKE